MKNALANWSLLDSASRWIRNALARHADEAALTDSAEAARIAGDLNLSVGELQALSAKDRTTPLLLQQRMSRLHLDGDAVRRAHPGVQRDLELVCALCGSESKCRSDLKRNPDTADWAAYCPNAPTLQELERELSKPT